MNFLKPASILSFLLVILAASSSCQNNNAPVTKGRKPEVSQKKIFRDSLPQPKDYVNDYENIYTVAEENMLDSIIAAFENSDSIQIALITFDSSTINKDSLDAITLAIANEWGVGEKYNNNGVTIGICIGHRRIRIQNGFGIEKIISNAETKEIIDAAFLPEFSNGNYFKGTLKGLNAMIAKLRKKSQPK